MKKLWCLFMVMLLMTGCAARNSDDTGEESYFISQSIEDMSDDGYVIVKEHDFEPITSSQTLCPDIQGVINVRAHSSSSEVIVCYDDSNQKTFSFADDDGILTIEYITKTHSGDAPCIIRSANSVYVYDEAADDFYIIADDFLFYLENYQDKYYYVNTAHDLVDSDGNIYCKNVVGVRADSNLNHTVVYVDDK